MAALALFLIPLPALAQDDWPQWRGPNGNAVAAKGETPPITWSETEHVIWRCEVPGRGHSSPTIVADRIFLTTADDAQQVQSVVAFDRASGRQLWKADITRGGFPKKIHAKNSHASCTVAADRDRVYAAFYNSDAIVVAALDHDGKKVWQENAGPYEPKQYQHGYASSPVLYKSMVIVTADYDLGGYLIALDGKTGKTAWKTERFLKSNYSSPSVARVAGRDQLLISGCDLLASYDPATGKPLWSADALTCATVGTPVWDGDLVFASGGYPKSETVGVRADGSAAVVWRNNQKCYEQSLLALDGHVYAVSDAGVAFCWKAADGAETWSVRLGGKVSASPTFAAGNIYASNEKGTTFVYRADPKEYKEIARNQLGDEAFASPTFCGNRIYLRVARKIDGRRQEMLYCIGQ